MVFWDDDGIVVIPQKVEDEVIHKVMEKVTAENVSRDEIRNGMNAVDVYKKYGV